MIDETALRLDIIERIKDKAHKANKGITTRWALKNAVKQAVQDWKVADYTKILDGKSRGHLIVSFDTNKIVSLFRNDQAFYSLCRAMTEIAENHGYAVNADSRALNMVAVE